MILRFYCIFCDIDLIFKVKSQLTSVKFPLKMKYFFYQLMDILQTCKDISLFRSMICLVFGDPDLILKAIVL